MPTTTTRQASTVTLPKAVFEVDVPNHELLKLAYNAYLANRRSAHAKTLTRGLVSGGGIKPWPQKGRNRARVGSIRSPIWRKGGIIFGPTGNQNFTVNLSTRSKRQALRQALTLAAQAKIISVVDDFAATDGRVKEALDYTKAHKATDVRQLLIVVAKKDDLMVRATRNLQGIKLTSATYLTVFDIMNADHILIGKQALKIIEDWLKG